ncbi:unnamed protein product [Notodromas monacha]|uniref:Uncharacterized protein n=1 Tax=Notodromas monacha TaxID=399045 RepID=A0A7R9BVM5_9CRUS|nr:unnamed protein product [Notodromas monacha]CAG0921239.1 unnamed protein product [Notodromas monacha]
MEQKPTMGDTESLEDATEQPIEQSSPANEDISMDFEKNQVVAEPVIMVKKRRRCVKSCRKAVNKRSNPCSKRSLHHGFLSCAEVHDLIHRIGIDDPENSNSCIRAAMMRGAIRIRGNPEELDLVMCRDVSPYCGHFVDGTLRDLLLSSNSHQKNVLLKSATPVLKCKLCSNDKLKRGFASVVGFCEGKPFFLWGTRKKTHCVSCPGFGNCGFSSEAFLCGDCSRKKRDALGIVQQTANC